MTNTLKDEISDLKTEAAAPKRRTRKSKRAAVKSPEPKAEKADDADKLAQKDTAEEIDELGKQLSEILHDAEDEIKAHPIAITLGAFALGIVVGAIIRR